MIETTSRTVSSLSDDELKAIAQNDPKLADNIRDLYAQGVSHMRYETELLNEKLSDFTQRTSLVMTVAGLLSFLPTFSGLDTEYVRHYLIWTFPLLIAAFVCFFFSSKRIQIAATEIPTAMKGSPEELIVLRNHSNGLHAIWVLHKKSYDSTTMWYRYTTTLVYVYLISLAIHFYMFAFLGPPPLCSSLLLTLSLSNIGIWMVLRTLVNSNQSLSFGSPV